MNANELLHQLIENADLLDSCGPAGERYLLISAPTWLLDALAEHGAADEDLENGHDHEDDGAREPNIASPTLMLNHDDRWSEQATVTEWRRDNLPNFDNRVSRLRS